MKQKSITKLNDDYEKSIFIEFMGDSPVMRIYDYLLSNRGLDFSISDIARNCKISRSTFYYLIDNLLENKIIIYTRTIGRSKLYTINDKLPVVKKLIEIDKLLVKKELERMKKTIKPS